MSYPQNVESNTKVRLEIMHVAKHEHEVDTE